MQITRKRIKGAILLLRQKKGADLVSFALNVKWNNSAVITVRGGETGKRRDNKLSSIVYNYLMFFFSPSMKTNNNNERCLFSASDYYYSDDVISTTKITRVCLFIFSTHFVQDSQLDLIFRVLPLIYCYHYFCRFCYRWW